MEKEIKCIDCGKECSEAYFVCSDLNGGENRCPLCCARYLCQVYEQVVKLLGEAEGKNVDLGIKIRELEEENAKLQEQLKNAPKFNCGDTFYWLTDEGVCKSWVLQIIFHKDRFEYINEGGIHFECDYGKESEQGLFTTEADAQKYLEEHND